MTMETNMMVRLRVLAMAAVLCIWSPLAGANQQVAAGDLVLLYSAIPSLDLQPEVARQYRLTRSAGRMLLNIALQRQQADGSLLAVAGDVSAAATNDAGQRQDLRLREVREGGAIYYLAEVRAGDGDVLTFEVEATVDGSPRPVGVRFVQPYFVPL